MPVLAIGSWKTRFGDFRPEWVKGDFPELVPSVETVFARSVAVGLCYAGAVAAACRHRGVGDTSGDRLGPAELADARENSRAHRRRWLERRI